MDIKFHGDRDSFRMKHPFSEDIEAAHAILFNARYNKWKKLNTYRKWVASGQPCLFGKAAAKTKSVFICVLEEIRSGGFLLLIHGSSSQPEFGQ